MQVQQTLEIVYRETLFAQYNAVYELATSPQREIILYTEIKRISILWLQHCLNQLLALQTSNSYSYRLNFGQQTLQKLRWLSQRVSNTKQSLQTDQKHPWSVDNPAGTSHGKPYIYSWNPICEVRMLWIKNLRAETPIEHMNVSQFSVMQCKYARTPCLFLL